MNRRQLITFSAAGIVFLVYAYSLPAATYTKQDVQDLVEHFKEHDEQTKPHFKAQEERLDELAEEIYKDIETYNTKETLKGHITKLLHEYNAICDGLKDEVEKIKTEAGYYDSSQVSPEFHKANLKGIYIELKMRLLGYIYQHIYQESYLDQ